MKNPQSVQHAGLALRLLSWSKRQPGIKKGLVRFMKYAQKLQRWLADNVVTQ